MIATMGALALAAATLLQQVDTTFPVPAGARIDIDNMNGQVQVRTWSRDAVRVHVQRQANAHVQISTTGSVVRVETRPGTAVPVRAGAPGATAPEHAGRPTAAIVLTVPRGMAVDIGGVFLDADVEGTAAGVSVRTVHGDVIVRGGSTVRIESVLGSVTTDGATGSVDARSVNKDVRVIDARGDVRAEAVNGNVILERIRSARVEAGTVTGGVSYAGALADGGRYSFTSHSGDVTVAVPAAANATLSLATMSGQLVADFPIQLTEARPGQRLSVVLGSGSAAVEVKSFSGRVRVIRAEGRDR
jgi:hypothetical protein